MLKFENVADVGDMIRAYDFKPRVGMDDVYVEGKVIGKGLTESGVAAYEIICTRDVFEGVRQEEGVPGSRVGKLVYVPFEVSIFEYDARIINLSK